MNVSQEIKKSIETKISKFVNIKNDAKIIQRFSIAEFSEGTQNQYIMSMRLFCECAGKTPSELIAEAISETKAGLLLSERKNLDYMAKFKMEMRRRNYSQKSTASSVAAVKSFYNILDIQLARSIGQIKKASTLRENRTFLKKEDVVKLISNAPSLRDRAIILVMATSGMARKEIINLRVRDISIDNDDISTISMRRLKNNIDFVTFISPEATAALKLYWEERERNISKIKDNDLVFVTFDGKKINISSFTSIFSTLAKNLVIRTAMAKVFK
jgi:integrase